VKPLRLGAGSRIDSHGVEKDSLPKIIFEDQNDTTQPSQSIELVDGALHVFNDPEGPNRTDLGAIPGSGGGGGGQVDEVQAGDHVNVDSTDPTKPIVSVPISGTPQPGDVVGYDGAGLAYRSGGINVITMIRDLTAVDGDVDGSTHDISTSGWTASKRRSVRHPRLAMLRSMFLAMAPQSLAPTNS
jgi:hypothetical protein